eukprot:225447-Rhodomonas_salina.1
MSGPKCCIIETNEYAEAEDAARYLQHASVSHSGSSLQRADASSQRREDSTPGDQGVRAGGGRGKSPVAGGLEERSGDLRAVGEGVDEDVHLAEVPLDRLSAALDVEALEPRVPLVLQHVLGDLASVRKHGCSSAQRR